MQVHVFYSCYLNYVGFDLLSRIPKSVCFAELFVVERSSLKYLYFYLLLQINGEITYNGITFKGFIPQRTAAYIEQTDLHLPELTVRETMNFAARVQGVGHKAGQHTFVRRT